MSLYANGQRQLKADLRAVHDAQDHSRAAQRARAAEERAIPAVDAAELDNARAVKVRHVGWRLVVRINKTTVTVQEPNSFDGLARYPHKNIIGAQQ